MAPVELAGKATRRLFVGIGVGAYDDKTLNLPEAENDVVKIADWFTRKSGVQHVPVLEDLAKSPRAAQVTESLGAFLKGLGPDDVVVMYLACHGEFEGARAYLFGCNTPREGMAGAAIEASTLGAMLGQSKPQNVLMIIDACVAGKLASAVQRAAEDTSDEFNIRDPHRPIALVVLSSTYGRDPAHDGRFAEAFLRVVSEERWTGTTSPWIDMGQVIRGLNEELKDIAPTQVAELRAWVTDVAKLIPNPNVATRKLGQLISTEEFQAHFDPASRGVARGETGSYFTGRTRELHRTAKWLEGDPESNLLVITGSPGSGKSALLSRAAVLADPMHRPDEATLAQLAEGTVPPAGALDGVIWCHNKSERQIVDEIAGVLGGSASSPDALVQLASGRSLTIAVDALDEIQEGLAPEVARKVLKPLSADAGIRLLVATRRRPVRHDGAGEEDLLDELGVSPGSVIDLDQSRDTYRDMRAYVEARIRGASTMRRAPAAQPTADLAARIAEAAGHSFLVAAIAARTAASGELRRSPDGNYVLPTEVGTALGGYIDALSDPGKARALLRPLAWSRGAGLPWGTLWSRLATALANTGDERGTSFGDQDVRSLLDEAGDIVVESAESGQPVYRLFHEALAEHLRGGTDASTAHDAMAQAMLKLREGRPWRQLERYVLANLPAHLLLADRYDDLVDVLLDPAWDRTRREESGDPLANVGIVDAAMERLLTRSPTDLRVVPICVAHSRTMTTAAPLILDVFARSGQLARAELMANNLTYAPDRMLAYRHLCEEYGRERDKAAARRCYEEVRRSLPAMPEMHRPMAWYWVAEAASAAGLTEVLEEAAGTVVRTALALEGDGWDLPNGYFWAARACALAGLEPLKQAIKNGLNAIEERGLAYRNQSLQAASVVGHRVFLERQLTAFIDTSQYPGGMIRAGNIALALVDAGMQAEANRVFELVGSAGPTGQDDSNKRWVWALALSGRMAEAIEALRYVADPIERGKAVARIADVAHRRGDAKALGSLVPLVKPLLMGHEARSQARLIKVLWLAGEKAEALSLAEQEVAAGHAVRPMADPRDGVGPRNTAEPAADEGPTRKTRKREMASSVVPVGDEQLSRQAASEASVGNMERARELLDGIVVPVYRAQALAAMARHDPDAEQAVANWLQALAIARRAGRGLVDEVRALGAEVLARAGRSDESVALDSQIEMVDARWELESFSEQYEALRRTLPPGRERTSRLESLLLIPRRLGRTHLWTQDDIRSGWESGEDGKRLCVLALMQSQPSAADVGVLTEGICKSRSAFEQYHALLAALRANLEGERATAIRTAVASVMHRDLQPRGSDQGFGPNTDRMRLAMVLLRVLPAEPEDAAGDDRGAQEGR